MGHTEPGALVRDIRERHGISRGELARRAGLAEEEVGRIEDGRSSPTFDELRALLRSMGEEPVLASRRLAHSADPVHMATTRALAPAARLERALEWNRFASELSRAPHRNR